MWSTGNEGDEGGFRCCQQVTGEASHGPAASAPHAAQLCVHCLLWIPGAPPPQAHLFPLLCAAQPWQAMAPALQRSRTALVRGHTKDELVVGCMLVDVLP